MRLGLGLGFSKVFSSGAVIVPPSASFDFTSALPTDWTVTRSGTNATYRNASGVWQSASANTARFDHDASGNALGVLIEPARISYSTNVKYNPTATTNMTKGGDAASVLSVVSAPSGFLAAVGLTSLCSNGNVYYLDNALGLTDAYVDFSGAVADTTAHSISVFASAATSGINGTITITNSTGSADITSTTASRVEVLNITPASSAEVMRITVPAGKGVYFIGNQLEKGKNVSSPIYSTSPATSSRSVDDIRVAALDTMTWWNQAAGAMFVEHLPLQLSDEMGVISAMVYADSNNYHLNHRILSTTGLIDGDFKSLTDQSTNAVGTALYDDFMVSGITWEENGEFTVTSSRGMRFEPVTVTSIAATLDSLNLGRSVRYFGYYMGHVKNVWIWNTKPTYIDATTTFIGANDVGVAFGGQSNSEGFDKKTTTGANGGQVAAIAELDNYFTTGRNFTSNMAIGGAGLYKRNNAFDYYLENDGVTAGPALINLIRANKAANVKGGIKFLYWAQGSSDVDAESVASLQAGWQEVFDQWRAAVGNLPVLIGRPFRRNDAATSDAGYVKWNDAISALIAANAWCHEAPNTKIYQGSWEASDPTGDNVHMSNAGYTAAAPNIIRKGMSIIGETVSGPVDGPSILSATGVNTTTITVNLSLPTGITDISPSSGIEGFIFEDDGTPITINSAVRTNATTITLTLASAGTGTQVLYYCYKTGFSDNRANYVVGNDARSLPLQVAKVTVTSVPTTANYYFTDDALANSYFTDDATSNRYKVND